MGAGTLVGSIKNRVGYKTSQHSTFFSTTDGFRLIIKK